MAEKVLEMRGMRRQEIMDYFMSLKGIGEDFQVEVSEESLVSMGSLAIPTTVVIFKGDKDQLEEAIYNFRIRFLTAGG